MLGSISANSPSVGHVKVNALQAIRHAAYNDSEISNDIAILKLVSNVTLTGKVKPLRSLLVFLMNHTNIANIGLVKLPPLSDATTTFNGTLATVSGFGKTTDAG
jgi:Trypsin